MENIAKLHFLGAAGVVTGSKTLIETPEQQILIDCGLFQGLKELRLLNWEDLPIDASKIDVVLLTHGHLDHVGYLPRLVKQGFRGKIKGTAPTLAIAEIILKDSAKIQEEEAKKANEEEYTKHNPALPFYDILEAESTIKQFEAVDVNQWVPLSDHISYRFQYNGHILGATFIELDIFEKRFVFSGDIGRQHDYLLDAPQQPEWADVLVLESTYGNKLHPKEHLEETLTQLVLDTLNNKGTLVIPSFAVERLQTLMYVLWKLYQKNKIPNIPIVIDSPMGNNVLKLFKLFPDWHKLPMKDYNAMSHHFKIVESYKETWEVIDDKRPKIVIAGSGMVTGGRVLTYLQQLIDEPSTTVLLVGYQAEGTRGRQLLDGAHEIRFFGKYYPVRASVKSIESLSAHADQKEIMNWLSSIKNVPEHIYLVHGEASGLDALRVKLKVIHSWESSIPKLNDVKEVMI
jgi:metallo-beta-lactamase family protein